MSEDAIVLEENEEFGLDDLIEAEEQQQAQAEEAEKQPDDSELERARLFAEKLNTGFLFGVNKLVCPSVENIDECLDREQGNEALVPLALELGGEVPPWLATLQEKYGPWIKAGVYMGTTVYTMKQIERQLQAQAANDAQNQASSDEGGENGEE